MSSGYAWVCKTQRVCVCAWVTGKVRTACLHHNWQDWDLTCLLSWGCKQKSRAHPHKYTQPDAHMPTPSLKSACIQVVTVFRTFLGKSEGSHQLNDYQAQHSHWCPQRNPLFTVVKQGNKEGVVIAVVQASQATQSGYSAQRHTLGRLWVQDHPQSTGCTF